MSCETWDAFLLDIPMSRPARAPDDFRPGDDKLGFALIALAVLGTVTTCLYAMMVLSSLF